jgi:hypothetical protein
VTKIELTAVLYFLAGFLDTGETVSDVRPEIRKYGTLQCKISRIPESETRMELIDLKNRSKISHDTVSLTIR